MGLPATPAGGDVRADQCWLGWTALHFAGRREFRLWRLGSCRLLKNIRVVRSADICHECDRCASATNGHSVQIVDDRCNIRCRR